MNTKYFIFIFIIFNLNYFTKCDAIDIKNNSLQQPLALKKCHVIVKDLTNHKFKILNYYDFKTDYTGLTLIYHKNNLYSKPSYIIRNGLISHVQNQLYQIKTVNC